MLRKLISITAGDILLPNHVFSESYHERPVTLSMVSTPDRARVSTDLSFVHLAVQKASYNLQIDFNVTIPVFI
jgi:hypothetical protein